MGGEIRFAYLGVLWVLGLKSFPLSAASCTQGKRDDAAACYSRALREGNAKVDALAAAAGDATSHGFLKRGSAQEIAGAALVAALGEATPEAAAAAAAADEMESRIASLREEKQAAVAAENYAAATKLKQEILDLQLRIIELEEQSTGRQIPKNAVGGGSGRRAAAAFLPSGGGTSFNLGAMLTQQAKSADDGGAADLLRQNTSAGGIPGAPKEKMIETWGSTQRLSQETKLDEAVTTG